jgi:hypothetical protein
LVKPLSETMLRAMFPAFDLAEWMAAVGPPVGIER